MNEYGQTVCLAMIVKNEALVLRACLESVRPFIDHWLIVDTGSRDGTQDLVRDALRDLPGELLERPWRDFAHNRNEALALAQHRADYVLIIDADEVVHAGAGFRLPRLTEDSYYLEVDLLGCRYLRRQLLRAALPWRYKGAVHEHAYCADAQGEGLLVGLTTRARRSGARARDPQTYHSDARLLAAAVAADPDNSRAVFYLAQSYRDAGELERAVEIYRRRVDMAGWRDEVWFSLYQIARLLDRLGRPTPEVLEAHLAAYQFQPDRAEPLFWAGMYYQARLDYPRARHLFAQAAQLPAPAADKLFVERALYDFQIELEYAVACHYVGDFAGAIASNNRLLRSGRLPPALFDHVVQNRRFSLEARWCEPRSAHSQTTQATLVFVVPMGDGACGLDDCVDSLLSQQGLEFQVVVFNDAAGGDPAHRLPRGDPRFTVYRHGGSMGFDDALRVWLSERAPSDIVMVLASGDRLGDAHALEQMRLAFEDPDCALLYGQHRRASGSVGDAVPAATEEEHLSQGRELRSRSAIAFRAGVVRRAAAQGSVVEAIWAAVELPEVRYVDSVLTIVGDAGERRRAVAPCFGFASAVSESGPEISCLLVTRDRLGLAKRAIRSFSDQTWPHRELVVVTDGDERYRGALQRFVSDARIPQVRFVVPDEPNLPLGALRNLSVRMARGGVVCQWDDDDVSHPDRLAVQVRCMLRENARACCLTDHLQHFASERTLRWIDWTAGGRLTGTSQLAPGTLMMCRDLPHRYPEIGPNSCRGEDSVLLERLGNDLSVAVLRGHGHLYLYEFHGRNSYPEEHHRQMGEFGFPKALLLERERELREALDYYAVPRPLIAVGADGPAFAVG